MTKIDDIPFGDYCYELTGEHWVENGVPVIGQRVCPFWTRKIDPEYNVECGYCSHLNSFDVLIDNQCKLCGINEYPEDEQYPNESGNHHQGRTILKMLFDIVRGKEK